MTNNEIEIKNYKDTFPFYDCSSIYVKNSIIFLMPDYDVETYVKTDENKWVKDDVKWDIEEIASFFKDYF